jgi:hypothetical protein
LSLLLLSAVIVYECPFHIHDLQLFSPISLVDFSFY